MELRHYTGAPVTLHRDLVYLQYRAHKPHGLWVSVPDENGEDGWVAFNEGEQFRPTTHAHRVVLSPCANVRVLSSIDEFDAFHCEYGVPAFWRPRGREDWLYDIDWPRVASEHDGIVIAPYLWARRMNPHWYYTWDCASGCIWNLSAIEEVVPVE